MVAKRWVGRLRDHCEANKSRCLFTSYLEGTPWPQYIMLSFPPHCHMRFLLHCNLQSHDKPFSYWFSLERKEKLPAPQKSTCAFPSSWGAIELQPAASEQAAHTRTSGQRENSQRRWEQQGNLQSIANFTPFETRLSEWTPCLKEGRAKGLIHESQKLSFTSHSKDGFTALLWIQVGELV